jgi:hypothetical protein
MSFGRPSSCQPITQDPVSKYGHQRARHRRRRCPRARCSSTRPDSPARPSSATGIMGGVAQVDPDQLAALRHLRAAFGPSRSSRSSTAPPTRTRRMPRRRWSPGSTAHGEPGGGRTALPALLVDAMDSGRRRRPARHAGPYAARTPSSTCGCPSSATIKYGCQRVQAALGYTDTGTNAGTNRAQIPAHGRTRPDLVGHTTRPLTLVLAGQRPCCAGGGW